MVRRAGAHRRVALRMKPVLAFALALLAGAVTVFAFAPFGAWPLQAAALGTLFALAQRAARPRLSFALGWAFGSAAMAAATWWLYVSMHDYGGMPAPMAALAVLLLAAALGLLYGSALWAATRLSTKVSAPVALLLAMPACWMLADWLRGWLFTGFPWAATGYAHTASPLAGFAPVVGVYGLGLLAAMLGGAVALLLTQRRQRAVLTALALLVALPSVGIALGQRHWTTPLGQPFTVRLLQGNVPQNLKFERAQLLASLQLYQQMIGEKPADLIATPETALPLLANHLPDGYLDELAVFGQKTGSRILIGVPVSSAPGIYLNSVLGIANGQTAGYRYDKHHLVPFGEFIPAGFRWFVDMMHIPLGDFGRGDGQQPAFSVKDQWVLPNICYEDLFGEEIAAQLAAAADRGAPVASVLLNVSNIAWFGDTIALPQHLQISQMRSLETGRPMLRSTNTGMTAIIDARGEVAARLAPFTRGTLEAQVQGTQGLTPYVRLGNGVPVMLALLGLLACWLIARRR